MSVAQLVGQFLVCTDKSSSATNHSAEQNLQPIIFCHQGNTTFCQTADHSCPFKWQALGWTFWHDFELLSAFRLTLLALSNWSHIHRTTDRQTDLPSSGQGCGCFSNETICQEDLAHQHCTFLRMIERCGVASMSSCAPNTGKRFSHSL